MRPLTLTTYYNDPRDGDGGGTEKVAPLAALAFLNAAVRAGCSLEANGHSFGGLLIKNPTPGANGCADWHFANLEGIHDEGDAPAEETPWTCQKCGSADVEETCWRKVNGEQITAAGMDGPFDHFHCNACEAECSIEQRPKA